MVTPIFAKTATIQPLLLFGLLTIALYLITGLNPQIRRGNTQLNQRFITLMVLRLKTWMHSEKTRQLFMGMAALYR